MASASTQDGGTEERASREGVALLRVRRGPALHLVHLELAVVAVRDGVERDLHALAARHRVVHARDVARGREARAPRAGLREPELAPARGVARVVDVRLVGRYPDDDRREPGLSLSVKYMLELVQCQFFSVSHRLLIDKVMEACMNFE